MSTVAGDLPTATGKAGVAPELAHLRVLLVHHWVYTWAGGERVLEQLVALMPHADILSGIITPDMRRRNDIARRARETWVGMIPGARTHHRWFLAAHALAFRMHDTTGYDLIVSVSHAFEKAIRPTGTARHLCYCLTPPRYLWDLGEAHERLATPLQRSALSAARAPLRALDKSLARGVDRFVSLSSFVAQRVKRAYGRDSEIVYPPVTAKPAIVGRQREDFFFTMGRLVPYKRVDLAVRAATNLGLPLIVAGDGPERSRLEAIAGPTVRFTGAISEEEAGRLLSMCAAFVFCAEEDFGIAPLEANAHGVPVVAYGAGGALETMTEGQSATFFDEQSIDAVAEAMVRCLGTRWDPNVLRANARRFTVARFHEGMRAQIFAALEDKRA